MGLGSGSGSKTLVQKLGSRQIRPPTSSEFVIKPVWRAWRNISSIIEGSIGPKSFKGSVKAKSSESFSQAGWKLLEHSGLEPEVWKFDNRLRIKTAWIGLNWIQRFVPNWNPMDFCDNPITWLWWSFRFKWHNVGIPIQTSWDRIPRENRPLFLNLGSAKRQRTKWKFGIKRIKIAEGLPQFLLR